MPAAIVADGVPLTHATALDDTPSDVLTGLAVDLIEDVWKPAFPSVELLDQAAALLPRVRHEVGPARTLGEGPRWFIRVGPGVIELRTKDYARADRTAEREQHRRQIDTELLADYLTEEGRFPDKPLPTRVITEWSAKSRANMVRAIGMLDFGPMFACRWRVPAMLTATYPGDWLTVAPSGREVKKHLKALRKRYERAWGETFYCLWKLEFQGRGAPHIHMLMVPPHGRRDGMLFREWMKRAWADVVAHPNPDEYAKHVDQGIHVNYRDGLSNSDPKRVGVYFSKHSSFKAKEYQHHVPEEWTAPGTTPGRFWGYWGLTKRTVEVEVRQDVAVVVGRLLRRWAAAQRVTRQTTRPRVRGGRIRSEYQEVIGLAGKLLLESQEPVRYRRTRTRARRMHGGRGFVMTNSGPDMASQLARYLGQVFPELQ